MNHIITCNPIGKIRSLKDSIDNFMVCHLHEKDAKFYLTKTSRIVYDLYVQDELSDEVDELLTSYDDTEIRVNEVPSLSVIPEMVSETILQEYTPEDLLDEDRDKEPPNVYISADVDFSRLMTAALNRQFRNDSLELEALNLLSYYHLASFAKMVEMMKRELESDFIYPEDPVSFAYVTNRLLRGNFRGMVM